MKYTNKDIGIEVEMELTTESTSSHYGLPVLRISGICSEKNVFGDFGPGDHIGNLLAGDIAVLSKIPGAHAFLSQHPEAARFWNLEEVQKTEMFDEVLHGCSGGIEDQIV